jgi:hypothetical protein
VLVGRRFDGHSSMDVSWRKIESAPLRWLIAEGERLLK